MEQFLNEKILKQIEEAFTELANRFNVRGVPQTVINSGAGIVVGAMPEQNLLAEIMRALQN